MHTAAPQPSRYTLRTTCPTCIRASTKDISAKAIFIRAKGLERAYALRLRSLAHIVDRILRGFTLTDHEQILAAGDALKQYAWSLTPWATAVAERMVAEVAQRDERSWFRVAAQMGRELRKEIEKAPTGLLMQKRIKEQVTLIKSLPLDAAERVHTLAREGKIAGTRADTLAAKILETGQVTKARANLIARTETSRTATELTAARATSIGSTHFRWVTAGDEDVRKTHKKLNGKIFRWDSPPECDPGHHALPGCIWSCRCHAEPILPGDSEYATLK